MPEPSPNPLITWLKTQPVVVLSPHFDDACLSLGAILTALDGATLVNVFTRSVWLRKSEIEKPTEAYVRAIRDAEDHAFAEHCRLARHDLNCYEPGIVGRNGRQLSALDEDIAQAREPVLAKLDELARPGQKCFLIAPLGVARHVNHLALADIILAAREHLAQNYDLLFYEDQPYAADFYQRVTGLRRFRSRLKGSKLARHVFIPEWHEKERLIGFYPSQFPAPNARRRFRPAALWPLVPHEALWSIS